MDKIICSERRLYLSH